MQKYAKKTHPILPLIESNRNIQVANQTVIGIVRHDDREKVAGAHHLAHGIVRHRMSSSNRAVADNIVIVDSILRNHSLNGANHMIFGSTGIEARNGNHDICFLFFAGYWVFDFGANCGTFVAAIFVAEFVDAGEDVVADVGVAACVGMRVSKVSSGGSCKAYRMEFWSCRRRVLLFGHCLL